MWTVFLFGVLFNLCQADVSHLQHSGYPSHKPEESLQLPNENHAGYPHIVPDNPLQIPEGSSGNEQALLPDVTGEGTSSGGAVTNLEQEQVHHDHHYHGEDGKYNPHDDGTGWDIRKSIPGEPDRDYPIYESVPTTSFSCREKIPGYYADEEARCQVFRVCTTNSEMTYNSFLCPNGSLFSQRSFTCDWWMNVDCSSSSQYYYKNKEIGKMPEGSQLMYEISKMLEAPHKNPFHISQEQDKFLDQSITDNQIQGSRIENDRYLPPKETIVTSTKKYYSPTTTPTTITTTTSTTPKPTVLTVNFGKVDTTETKDNNFTQQTIQNVQTQQLDHKPTVGPQYIPPPTPTIDQSSISNVQNKVQVGQTALTQITQTEKTTVNTEKTSQVNVATIKPVLVSQTVGQNKLVTSKDQSQSSLFLSQKFADKPTLFTSQLTQTNPAQPLFVSPIADQNQKQDQLNLSQKFSGMSDSTLFTSQLTHTNNAQPLLVSPIANQNQKQDQLYLSQKFSGMSNPTLFTSQLTHTNNAQPLFVAPITNQNQKQDQLYLSPKFSEMSKPPLFTSQLTHTHNAQPLFVSPATDQNKLYVSPEQQQISQTVKSGVEKNSGNLFLSQIEQSGGGYEYNKQNIPPTVTVTKEQTQTVKHSEKTTHVYHTNQDEPQKISLLNEKVSTIAESLPNLQIQQQNTGRQQQTGISQETSSGVQQQTGISQETSSRVQQQNIRTGGQTPALNHYPQEINSGLLQSSVPNQLPQISTEQAFQDINRIQANLEQLMQKQYEQTFGKDKFDVRLSEHVIPTQNFKVDHSSQNLNRYSNDFGAHLGVQPHLINQGYQYQNPNYHEQNLNNFNYHWKNGFPNGNIEVSKDGTLQNYQGESLSQHSNGQTHSSYSGHDVGYKKVTKVDIVPSLGFSLNDEFDRNRYLSAVLKGFLQEQPTYQNFASSNVQPSLYEPTDARYSSYHGPSSYLVPQMSVQQLPSDSHYHR